MNIVDAAYKKWDKDRTQENKDAWYKAVKKFNEIHSYNTPVKHKRSRHRKDKPQAHR